MGFSHNNGLNRLAHWLDHVEHMGFNAVYLSPVWQSHDHGYDTIDYHQVDPRLGCNDDLKQFIRTAHAKGIRVVLDGVFNHVGRGFFAFQDLLKHREHSAYKDWFVNVNFGQNNHHQDGFSYQCWEGHEALVQLNVLHEGVQHYLLGAVDAWVREYEIDGLRLDAADCVDHSFWRVLRNQCNGYEDFWLMGEIIHGNYTQWVNQQEFHSVTNYELYKGLWSSFNDVNFHEVAHSLKRQFGAGGVYEGACLYNFVDNHDVARIASVLKSPSHAFPLHLLLYTVPGIPSIYYGSEWHAKGKKDRPSDWHLRPCETELIELSNGNQDLKAVIQRLNALRAQLPELAMLDYREITVTSDLLSFGRGEDIIVMINASDESKLQTLPPGNFIDVLNHNQPEQHETSVSGHWGRVLVRA
jgi:glycosidase